MFRKMFPRFMVRPTLQGWAVHRRVGLFIFPWGVKEAEFYTLEDAENFIIRMQKGEKFYR